MKKLSEKHLTYAILFTIIVITFIFVFWNFLLGKQYFIFSDSGSDCQDQYYPMYLYLISQIKQNNLTLWNNFWGLGCDTFTNQMWIMDPFGMLIVLMGCLLGDSSVPFLILGTHFIKVVLSAFLAYKYLGYFNVTRNVKIIGAYVYGFNSFLMVWGQHYWFGVASIYIIVLLLTIEKWLRTGRKKFWLLIYCLCVGIFFMYSVYVAYMAIIMTAVYACIRFIYQSDDSGIRLVKDILRNAFWFLAATIVGMLMASAMILPFLEINMGVTARITTESLWDRIVNYLFQPYDAIYYLKILLRMISSNSMGVNNLGGDYYGLPELSVSIVGIPVIAEGVVAICYQTHVKRKRYVFVISLILILFVLFVPLGSCIFNALQFPFGRYTFVLLPIFTIVFSKGLDRICNEKRMSFLACGVATVGVIGLVAISAFIFENDSAIRSYDKFIIVCNILTFVLIFLITKRRRNGWVYCFFLLIIVGCSVDNRVGNGNRETADNVMVVDRSETLEAVQNLQELDQSFFRIEKTYHDFTPWNDSLLEGYAPSTGYNSNIGRYMDLFYRNMWPEVINNGATRVTYAGEYIMEGGKEGKNNILTLLGVKYILSKERIKDMGEYYEEMEISEADIYVYRNLRANSVITGYDKVITESAFEELSREDRNAILGTYLVLDDEEAKESQYYTDVIDRTKNDEFFIDNQYVMALVKDTYFSGEVFMENDKMLFFSIPFREGWNIYIDGEQVETYRADYGFIACEISRGEHIIELRYENNIYLAGVLLSLIGVLIWVIGLRVTGKK